MRPETTPIGLHLTRTSRLIARTFDDALVAAGGSLPVWLALLNLKIHHGANQRELAQAVGVTQATLTHHLAAMERDGLIIRSREPTNRRNHVIQLTAQGEAKFKALAAAARNFDEQLRANVSITDLETLRTLLDRLSANVRPGTDKTPTAPLEV
jgi:MarR family transcriptional regulator for hemolysin